MNNNYRFVFFGSSDLSVLVLEELKKSGFLPALIVTTMDKPRGRKLVLTPPEAKLWADKENILCQQLKTLRTPEAEELLRSYGEMDFFVVASYGKIIPQNILDIPKKGTLNVHPSLLPKLRGASPIKGAILNENETGVSIMLLDAEMDHGPILAQEKVLSWDMQTLPYEKDLKETLGKKGGEMLSEVIPKWMNNEITPIEQNHDLATLCGKIEKADGELDLSQDPEINLRKIRAYHVWPGAYFFQDHSGKKIRVNVKTAKIENDSLVLERIVPEGKKEMNYSDFLRGLR